jgi:hypothetical protein
MIHDHSDANARLAKIAEKGDLALPQTMDDEHQNQLAHLERLK